jgi:hypothetical protein
VAGPDFLNDFKSRRVEINNNPTNVGASVSQQDLQLAQRSSEEPVKQEAMGWLHRGFVAS